MDFQSHYQDPLNSMNYQFQNISLQNGPHFDPAIARMGTPVHMSMPGSAQPLSRQASIMDSIGIQRSSSPFVDSSLGLNLASAPSAAGTNTATAGASSSLASGHMLNSLSHQESATSSPYPSQMATPNVMHGGLFSPGVGDAAAARAPPMLIESQWRYIDTQGQIQGPFGSGPMSQWYAGGYFQPSLQVSRVPTTLEPFGINDNFVTLGDLISKVNNFQDPFHAFDLVTTNILPALNVPATASPEGVAAPGAPVAANSLFQQQQQQQQQQVNGAASTAALPSQDYTHDEILKLRDLDGGYYHNTAVQVPTGSRKQEKVSEQERLDRIALEERKEADKRELKSA